MKFRSTTPVVESGILSALAIIFAFISAYLPVFGILIGFIWPVPIILLGVRHGYQYSIMATLVAGLLIALLIHPLQALSVVVGFGLIGIALGHAFRSRYSPAKTLMVGSAASLICKLAVLAITALMTGVNPLHMQMEAFDTAISQTMSFYQNMGYNEADLQKMTETMTVVVNLVKVILPAGLIMASVMDTLLNYWLAKKVLKKLGYVYMGLPPFPSWCLPRSILVLFLVGLGMLLLGRANENELVTMIGTNVQVVGSVLLLVQGLALFYFLAAKYNLSRFVRGIILVLILTNGFFTQIVILAGAFDMAIDYRHLRSPRLK
ncbi:MAG: YybS family protein [Sporomusaceae bacterium]|nr:YybS family protein [Sporomusaceae bacterium]